MPRWKRPGAITCCSSTATTRCLRALAAIAGRLEATGDPEILIYDYVRTYWNGEVRPNQRRDLLTSAGPDAFSLADRPQLLDLLQIVCNKAYRRDFIARQGLAFPPGYDAGRPLLLLISADRIAVLDRAACCTGSGARAATFSGRSAASTSTSTSTAASSTSSTPVRTARGGAHRCSARWSTST